MLYIHTHSMYVFTNLHTDTQVQGKTDIHMYVHIRTQSRAVHTVIIRMHVYDLMWVECTGTLQEFSKDNIRCGKC